MTLQYRWLIYAILMAAPALLAWEDFFYLIATGESSSSLLRSGTPTAFLLFTSALALPLLYVASARLRRPEDEGEPRRTRIITILYLFAAVGYILDAVTFGAFHEGAGDQIVYYWAIFLMVIYLPVVTTAVVLLTTSRRRGNLELVTEPGR